MSNPMMQPQQQVEVDLDTMIQTLTGQRNQALDAVAQQAGVIARLQRQIAELKDQLPAKPNGDGRAEVRAAN